ncbi:TraI domain-containing protein [Xenorhabdus bovienii]|uniref:TraI domain-containing protein n=1 Tax=Xenorhabdus bovienii TaxID=40576 RepID=UPI001EDD13B0|nr:TraI domain-containing protein [Xenorhabdus bovienii]MCG3460795.1 TraI domain-containing protein [Xenorhabdus bovienii]
MFNRFKPRFTRQATAQQNAAQPQPAISHSPGSYFRPQSADELLVTPLRRQCLQQLWENSGLPQGLYQRFYLAPIKQLLGSVQQIPAAQEGDWSGRGGFVDLTLKFTTCAVRLAKGYMLPPGAAPETQAAQNVLWQAVVFWAALFYHLPLLRQLEGELEDGHYWQPGVSVPDKPFRFRFRTPENTPSVPQEALLAASLLPEAAILWLVSVPEAWRCLVQHLSGCSFAIPLIGTLLQETAGQVQVQSPLPLLKSVEPSEPVSAAAQSSSAPHPVFPLATPEAAVVPDTADDTQTLLSLFQTQE